MIKTPICELLNIEYPIIQGGMAWVADASLAAAVSNGGGLGLIAAAHAPVEWVRNEIRTAKKLTNKPFGVNIMLMSPYVDDIAQLVIDEGVQVVTTGAGSPAKYMEAWQNAGIKVIPVIASVAMAKKMVKCGAVAIVAEGCEAGGHIGELTTMCLVPQVCDAVSIPVIAAGGVADGRGIVATFALGAMGVQVGTRFLVADECTVHYNYKEKVLKARDIDTITTGKRLGHPVRCLKNPFSRDMGSKEYDSTIPNEQLENLGVGALRVAAVNGDTQKGCFMAGQSAGMVTKAQSAKDIIEEMFNEALVVLEGENAWVK